MRSGKLLAIVAIILLSRISLYSQAAPDLEQGLKPYGSFHGGDLDHVSLTNGNLFFLGRLFSYFERGELDYPIELQYDNKNFSFYQTCAPPPSHSCSNTAVFGAPPDNPQQSNGSSVTLGFEGLPTVVGVE